MDVIEKLIKSLQEAKAELEKNMNCAPGMGGQNMDKIDEPHKDDPNHEKKEKKAAKKIKDEAEDILDMHKEELMCSENGQWYLKKDAANPALAPKAKKVKMLQQQIDAGTYKPNASKIADKMLQKNEESELEKNNRNRGKQAEQQRGYSFSQIMEGKRHSDEMDRQVKANAVAPIKKIPLSQYKPQTKVLKEELTCSENGQWDIKSE